MIAMSGTKERLGRLAETETYHDVARLIDKLAGDAVRRHGGCWEDYVSAGNAAFVDAYRSYDNTKGTSFSTWVWWKIRGAISAEIKKTKVQSHTVASGKDNNLDELTGRSNFDLSRFASELSEDARTVIKLVLESSDHIKDVLHHRDAGPTIKHGLRRKLSAMRWTLERILESFDEIREALQ